LDNNLHGTRIHLSDLDGGWRLNLAEHCFREEKRVRLLFQKVRREEWVTVDLGLFSPFGPALRPNSLGQP